MFGLWTFFPVKVKVKPLILRHPGQVLVRLVGLNKIVPSGTTSSLPEVGRKPRGENHQAFGCEG